MILFSIEMKGTSYSILIMLTDPPDTRKRDGVPSVSHDDSGLWVICVDSVSKMLCTIASSIPEIMRAALDN